MVFTASCDFVISNSPIIDLFLPCTIVTLVDNWLPSRLISSQLSRLRLLGISSERWGKYLVFSYSFESFFMLKVVLLVLSAFTFKNWRVFWVSFVLNSFNVSKRLSIHPYWFDAGQMPITTQNVLECHIIVAFGGNPDMGPRTILFKNFTGQFLSDRHFFDVSHIIWKKKEVEIKGF